MGCTARHGLQRLKQLLSTGQVETIDVTVVVFACVYVPGLATTLRPYLGIAEVGGKRSEPSTNLDEAS